MAARRGLLERFWNKVDQTGDCWIWIGATNRKGYGRFGVNRVLVATHRFSWELVNGPIPEGMQIDHICHNPPCVNPAHLRLATPKQNRENLSGPSYANNRSSGIRGVTWDKQRDRWTTQVNHNGKVYRAGSYRSIEDAAEAVRQLRNRLYTHNDADRISIGKEL